MEYAAKAHPQTLSATQGPIADSIDEVVRALNDLESTIGSVYSKFEPILSAPGPTPASKDVAPPTSARSKMASGISGLARRIVSATMSLQELRDRAEL